MSGWLDALGDWLAGPQSALSDAGIHAAEVHWLHMLLLAGAMLGFLVVMAAVWLAWRAEKPQAGTWIVWLGGIAFPVAMLAVFIVLSMQTTRAVSTLGDEDELVVRVIGKQYWWDVIYAEDGAAPAFRTANEIHVPVGRPVRFLLESDNVIHSFWVPSLGGKMDMIPGRTNELVLRADRAGVYRGQCAEFCGIQHARMAFEVIAHEPEDFEAWRARRVLPQPEPDDPFVRRGREAFVSEGCAGCHEVSGHAEGARAGPDLTDMGARRTLGSGMWPNNPGNMGGWIADAQTMKPGNEMPAYTGLDGVTLRALTAYMDSLQ